MKKSISIISILLAALLLLSCFTLIPFKAEAEITIDKVNNKIYSSATGVTAKDFAAEAGCTFDADDGYIVRTGTKAMIDGAAYTVIIFGDCAPDGEVDTTDIIALKRHILGIKKLDDDEAEAVSLSGGKTPGTTDFIILKRFILGITASLVLSEPETTQTVKTEETYGGFTISTTNGKFERSGSVFTLSAAGTYKMSGELDGQIVVNAGENDEVEMDLEGVSISNSGDAPIKILSAGSADISAKTGTVNAITDNRSAKTVDTDTLGEGAIYAKADLKIKGAGSLSVIGNYNNGIHTTKDLTVQKLTLSVKAYNNALKGNDSIKIKSGDITVISTNGDGMKTENTDLNKNGEVRGNVLIIGGTLTVYAAGDGIQAAHNFEMSADSEGGTATVEIYTGTFSSYTASNTSSVTSWKGIKAQNQLNIKAGELTIGSHDDGLHADYGTAFTSGGKGEGTINVSGGTVNISVSTQIQSVPGTTTPTNPGGRPGRPGPGGQQGVKGSDAIHADYKLNISGGLININSSYEGLEASVITVSGGKTYVSATDDGVNANKKTASAQIVVTGGYLDVTVPANGDTDGIDSNGTYTQSGGIVIARGPNQSMSAALDTDSTCTISGGTIIVLGYTSIRTSGSVKTYSLSLHSAGSHSVKIGGETYTFNNSGSYGKTVCYSSVSVTAA